MERAATALRDVEVRTDEWLTPVDEPAVYEEGKPYTLGTRSDGGARQDVEVAGWSGRVTSRDKEHTDLDSSVTIDKNSTARLVPAGQVLVIIDVEADVPPLARGLLDGLVTGSPGPVAGLFTGLDAVPTPTSSPAGG